MIAPDGAPVASTTDKIDESYSTVNSAPTTLEMLSNRKVTSVYSPMYATGPTGFSQNNGAVGAARLLSANIVAKARREIKHNRDNILNKNPTIPVAESFSFLFIGTLSLTLMSSYFQLTIFGFERQDFFMFIPILLDEFIITYPERKSTA